MIYEEFIKELENAGYQKYGPEPSEPNLELWFKPWNNEKTAENNPGSLIAQVIGVWASDTIYINKNDKLVQLGQNCMGIRARAKEWHPYININDLPPAEILAKRRKLKKANKANKAA